MPRRKLGSPFAKAEMEAQVQRYHDSLPWVLVSAGAPEGETGFVLVRLSDGTVTSAKWQGARGWLFMPANEVRQVIAWAKPPNTMHSCSQ